MNHDVNPRPTVAAAASSCPRCGEPAYAGTGGWLTCRCGLPWPVHAAEVAEPVDVLGGAALSVERLRAYLHGPQTPAERSAARRRLDQMADGRW